MRAYFFEMRERWEQERIERGLPEHTLDFSAEPLTAGTAAEAADAEIVSVFVRSAVDRAALARLPAVRLVAARATGYDRIDVEACAERGVVVVNVPRYGENTVAEHTFGLILNLSRKIYRAYDRTRRGDFSLEGLEGVDLRGRMLGVVGAGNIGLRVIRIGRAFGMEAVAYDVAAEPLLADVLGFRYVPLEELLAVADVVSLHVPATPATRHLLNRERFRRMKRGVLLVNTARGSVVETGALLWALEEGIVAGAGLDVLEGEELLAEERLAYRTQESEAHLRELLYDHVLLRREDVILTPHMAWYSREARERILETTVANIRAWQGGEAVNVVAPAAGRADAGERGRP